MNNGREARYPKIRKRLGVYHGIIGLPGMRELADKYVKIVRRKIANEV